MITVLTGVPGSGKTYYAVHLISQYDKEKQAKVLHNIDGLKLGKRLDDYCVENKVRPIQLFQNSFHEKNKEFRGWTLIVDECQRLFPKRFNDTEVFNFFELHRHYGIDIILITQDAKKVSYDIITLAEWQYRAVSDAANPLPGSFLYKQQIGGEDVGRKTVRKSKKVFALYKTADFDQSQVGKKVKPMRMLLLVSILAVFFILYFGYRYVSGFRQPETNIAEKTYQNAVVEKRSNKHRYSTQNAVDTAEEYPQSLLDIYNGVIVPVDNITDHSGSYVILLGIAFAVNEFPFPLVGTRLGLAAVLPQDVYQAQKQYTEEIILAGQFDPNEEYLNESESEEEPRFN